MQYKFDSKIEISQVPLNHYSTEHIKNEPMLFSCDYLTALQLGGPITRDFLTCLLNQAVIKSINLNEVIIDSRVHMLMPNWYACIPGWHLDDVPRELPNRQPNHRTPSYRSNHCMAMVGGDICPTQFALGQAELPEIKEDEKYYKVWHPYINDQIYLGTLKSISAPDRRLIFFDWQTFHQGTKAVADGWRFFIRASWNTNRKPTNELRRQVQVYLENPMEGW